MPLLSTALRFSKVNMLSCSRIIKSASSFSRPPMIEASKAVLVEFMIKAAALIPPKLEDFELVLVENCNFIIDSSSCMAEG